MGYNAAQQLKRPPPHYRESATRARLVLIWLAVYADDRTGVTWPSGRVLAVATGYNRNTVIAALDDLECAKLIERDPPGNRGGGGRGTSYRLPWYVPNGHPW